MAVEWERMKEYLHPKHEPYGITGVGINNPDSDIFEGPSKPDGDLATEKLVKLTVKAKEGIVLVRTAWNSNTTLFRATSTEDEVSCFVRFEEEEGSRIIKIARKQVPKPFR